MEAQGLREIPELQDAVVSSGDGHRAFDSLKLDIGSATLELKLALHADRAHDIAAAEVDAYVTADVLQPHAGVVRADLDIAGDIGDIKISTAAMSFDGCASRHCDLELGRGARVAGNVVLIRPDNKLVGVPGQLEGRILVGAISSALIKAADGLASGYLD